MVVKQVNINQILENFDNPRLQLHIIFIYLIVVKPIPFIFYSLSIIVRLATNFVFRTKSSCAIGTTDYFSRVVVSAVQIV